MPRDTTPDGRSVRFIESVTLGETSVDFYDIGVDTVLPDGTNVWAEPQGSEGYRHMARDLGYGEDTLEMCREHELGHSVLAALMGMPYSPTMWGLTHPPHNPHYKEEEAVVLSLQRYCRVMGTKMIELAWRLMEGH